MPRAGHWLPLPVVTPSHTSPSEPAPVGGSTGEDAEDYGHDLPEQMQVRRDKRDRLVDSGAAYPVKPTVTHSLAQVRSAHSDLEAGEMSGREVSVAGRVMFLRNTGKLCFANLMAGDGTRLQVMLSLNRVGAAALEDWKGLVDIGDHVAVTGEVGTSRRGELSVFADTWTMASKSLRPLPVAHKPLAEETRVRRRYLDLIMRPEAQQMARERIAVVAGLRHSLGEREYLEVETPMLQTMHGGAAARPFVTHMNAFDLDLYLRIAPELFLKRAVVGGLDRVFEINRNFRNEGADSTHSPEFSMLEFYEAYADYHDMARTTREIIQEAALTVHDSLQVTHFDGTTHDLSGQWSEVSLFEATSDVLGESITPATDPGRLARLCSDVGIEPQSAWVPGKYAEELFEHHVVPTFDGPTFVFDYPTDMSPLVRAHRSKDAVVEKWDLYVDGYELATGYSELVDPVIQRQRLMEQTALRAAGDAEAMQVDEEFLRAMEHGMPPSGGVGLGIDRLLMTLTGRGIRDTILFPLVKPSLASGEARDSRGSEARTGHDDEDSNRDG